MKIKFKPDIEYKAFYNPAVKAVDLISSFTNEDAFGMTGKSLCIVASNDKYFIDLEIWVDNKFGGQKPEPFLFSIAEEEIEVDVNISNESFYWESDNNFKSGIITFNTIDEANYKIIKIGKNPVYLIILTC